MSLKLVPNEGNSSQKLPVVAIDGPAGSGKSTAARLLAAHLNFTLIDTGALYRCLAHQAHEKEVSLSDGKALADLCAQLKISFAPLDRSSVQKAPQGEIIVPKLHVFCNGIDVTDTLRSPELGMAASNVSKLPEVRAALLDVQRKFGAQGGVVLEGRDIGTVVFPDAEVKFYLDAQIEARAKRRQSELKNLGIERALDQVIKETKARDEQDMNRKIAPLKKAEDARNIDSSNRNLEEVVQEMAEFVRKYLKESS